MRYVIAYLCYTIYWSLALSKQDHIMQKKGVKTNDGAHLACNDNHTNALLT
jgi:hypothetical protein